MDLGRSKHSKNHCNVSMDVGGFTFREAANFLPKSDVLPELVYSPFRLQFFLERTIVFSEEIARMK